MVRVYKGDARAILVAARRGDTSAQEALFNEHKHRVGRHVLRMTGDVACVDDVVQEVFISAFAALPGFRREAQLVTWLYAITSHKVRTLWDARCRRELREQCFVSNGGSVSPSPEDVLQDREQLKWFYSELDKLPSPYRDAFAARAIDKMTLSEASKVLGVPISTVSYRTRRAERLMRHALGLKRTAT